MRPPVRLRPVTAADHAATLALNAAEEARLAPLAADRLPVLQGWSDRCDVIEVDGGFAGFVVTFAPGSAYDSENYRWFADRFGSDFYYLDRVALAPQFRRRGVASAAYDELEQEAAAYGRMTLEAYVDNAGSLAFHERRGYVEVGRRGEPEHPVSLMAKEL